MPATRTTIQIFQQSDEAVSFPAGSAVFAECDPGDLMYVVKSGEVELDAHGVILEVAGPGAILGESALLDGEPRSATAIAKTDAQLVPINEDRFQFLVQQTPYFAIDVMRIMADRLRAMNARV